MAAASAAITAGVEQLAAETVSARVLVLYTSQKTTTSEPLIHLDRVSVDVHKRNFEGDIAEKVKRHNREIGRSGETPETKSGAPHWKAVAYMGPFTAGDDLVKSWVQRLCAACDDPEHERRLYTKTLEEEKKVLEAGLAAGNDDDDLSTVRAIIAETAWYRKSSVLIRKKYTTQAERMRACMRVVSTSHFMLNEGENMGFKTL